MFQEDLSAASEKVRPRDIRCTSIQGSRVCFRNMYTERFDNNHQAWMVIIRSFGEMVSRVNVWVNVMK